MKKKLQLKKETIAVLNGEGMLKVVGGTGNGCQFDAECGDGFVCVNGICVGDDTGLVPRTTPQSCNGNCTNDCPTLTCESKCAWLC